MAILVQLDTHGSGAELDLDALVASVSTGEDADWPKLVRQVTDAMRQHGEFRLK